jgi:phosphoserine/homoserine phosphotransferase
MLRGPQTLGELRTRTERFFRFDTLAEVEAALVPLADAHPSTAGRETPAPPRHEGAPLRPPAGRPDRPRPRHLAPASALAPEPRHRSPPRRKRPPRPARSRDRRPPQPNSPNCVKQFAEFPPTVRVRASPARLPRGGNVSFTPRLVKQSIVTLDMEGVLTPEIWIAVAEAHGHPRTAPHDPGRARLRQADALPHRHHGSSRDHLVEDPIGHRRSPAPARRARLPHRPPQRAPRSSSSPTPSNSLPSPSCARWAGPPCCATGSSWKTTASPATSFACRTRSARPWPRSNRSTTACPPPATRSTTPRCSAQADRGFLFHAPDNIIRQFPQFPALNDYNELLKLILSRC